MGKSRGYLCLFYVFLIVAPSPLGIEAVRLFPMATILWALSFCLTCVGHYTPNYAQDATHHAMPQSATQISILWNNIPPSIRVSTTICSFKKSLKTHLYYYSVLFIHFFVCILALCCSELYSFLWYKVL